MKQSAFNLPFESLIRERILRKNYFRLFPYAVLELFIIVLIFSFNKVTIGLFIQKFMPIIIIYVTLLNLDIFFLLHISQSIKESIPKISALARHTQQERELPEIFKRNVYNLRRLVFISLAIVVFGEITFTLLGLDSDSKTVLIFCYLIAIPVGFTLAGAVLHLGVGVWMSIYQIGQLDLKIWVFAPDRLGGTKVIGDLGLKVTYIGGIVALLYSLGAHYSPYLIVQAKHYAYIWVLAATIFLILSFIIPTYSLHKILSSAKKIALREAAAVLDKIYVKCINSEHINREDLEYCCSVYSLSSGFLG